MANDTKAPPERIWAWPTYSWLSGAWAQTRFPETAESYTRTADALAAQGALIERVEDAMQSVDQEQAGDGVMWGDMAQLSYAISNLSPDATAALEAVMREAVGQERARIIAKVYEIIHNSRHVTLGDKLIAAIRETDHE